MSEAAKKSIQLGAESHLLEKRDAALRAGYYYAGLRGQLKELHLTDAARRILSWWAN